MLVSYTWLKTYLGDALPAPEALVDLLTFHSFEIEGVETVGDDTVIDVDVLPNRSSDCLSHRGIAREIASVLDVSLRDDPLGVAPTLPATDRVTITLSDPGACPRFTALHLSNVTVAPSPDWLQTRLRALGQRPINNVVDVTNYVMYAIGQPVHAYDADAFPAPDGTWSFGVRDAVADETIALLGEGDDGGVRTVPLTGTELVVTDTATDTPIGLAGVKGGTYAGVTEATKMVLIEAAHFDPARTRRTARQLGIIIDASKRFENEPSRELPLYAQALVAELLGTVAGATVEGYADTYPLPTQPPTVTLQPEHVTRVLGVSITTPEMVALLERTGSTVAVTDAGLQCTGPMERTDLHIPEDFIEEIGRLYGYENIPSVTPDVAPLAEINALHYYSERVRAALCEAGCTEIITTSFRKKDTVVLQNALASDKGCLRSALTPNVRDSLERNAPHTDLLGTADTRLFEIGTVFTKDDTGVTEHVALALGVQIRPAGYSGKEDKALATLQTIVAEALGTTEITWIVHKGVAECDFSTVVDTLPKPTEYDPVPAVPAVTYQPFSVYPSMTRDVAFWVDGETSKATAATVLYNSLVAPHVDEAAMGAVRAPLPSDVLPALYLQRLDCFDEFQKDGRTSFAFRLVFQSYEQTLTDEAVQQVMAPLYAALEARGWEVR